MTNKGSISLSKSKFVLLRRIITSLSFASVCIGFVLLLAGFIPFRGRDLTAIAAINNILEFVYIGKKDFFVCAFTIITSIIYMVFAVKNIISIVTFLTKIKQWLISDEDSYTNRETMQKLVTIANSSLWCLFFLYVFSFTVDNFIFSGFAIVVLAALALLVTVINFLLNMTLKADLLDSAITSIGRLILFAAPFVFVSTCLSFQLTEIFRSLGYTFTALTVDGVDEEQLWLAFARQSVFPVFYFFALIHFFNASKEAANNFYRKGMIYGGLIRHLVFLAIMMAIIGFIGGYSTLPDYIDLLFDHVSLILVSLTVFCCAGCAVSTKNNIPIFESNAPEMTDTPDDTYTEESFDGEAETEENEAEEEEKEDEITPISYGIPAEDDSFKNPPDEY